MKRRRQFLVRLVGPSDKIRASLKDVIGGDAELDVALEIPFQRLKRIEGLSTMIAAFTTDVPALPNWGEPLLFGPGSIHVAHTPNERLAKQEQREAIDLYVQVAASPGPMIGRIEQAERFSMEGQQHDGRSARTRGRHCRSQGKRPTLRTSKPAKNHLNGLANASSSYLRSAMHQPVDWQEWGDAAFARAKSVNKPVLLDIGAVWCHWCHVMDRESYEDPEIAEIINDTLSRSR